MAGAAGEAIDAARENFANDIGKKVATALYELPAGRAKSRRCGGPRIHPRLAIRAFLDPPRIPAISAKRSHAGVP